MGGGLGLATVYGAVNQNGGFIVVDSAHGLGTTITVHLPRQAGVPAREQTVTLPVPRGQGTILLVEDEPEILNVTRRLLEGQGYTVLAAGTPGEAMRLAREHPGEINLLLTDVLMPEMNGRDLALKLRAVRGGLKECFMSGYSADIIAQGGVLDVQVNFLQKPFSGAELAEKVRAVLNPGARPDGG